MHDVKLPQARDGSHTHGCSVERPSYGASGHRKTGASFAEQHHGGKTNSIDSLKVTPMCFNQLFTRAGQAAVALSLLGLYSFTSSSTPMAQFRDSASAVGPAARQESGSQRPDELFGSPQESSLTAEEALHKKVDLLRKGLEFLKSRGSYSAEMAKQELVGGELQPEHVIALKCRQQPFSVYLLWHTGDPGREVLYIEGQNRGRLIGHDGGWKARLPALSLAPDSSLAMRDARYPVTKAGLGGLSEIMIGVHEADLQRKNFSTCDYRPHVPFDGRDCHAFVTVYNSAAPSPDYRKSVTLIDREWCVPLSSQHYAWPQRELQGSETELDAATLIESYQFTKIDFDRSLTDADFDRRNDDYAFR